MYFTVIPFQIRSVILLQYHYSQFQNEYNTMVVKDKSLTELYARYCKKIKESDNYCMKNEIFKHGTD